MTGPNRGRGEQSMTNEVYVIRRILKFVEVSNLINLKNVIDVGQLEAYVTKLLEKNTVPSSIKKYIGSLRDFLQFLTTQDQYCMDAASIAKTDTILSHWAKNFKKKDKVCTHKRKQDDRELLIDKRQVSAFDNGPPKIKADKLFELYNNDLTKTLIRSDFCSVRDYLIVELQLSNASRSGVITNMQMSEFLGATLHGDVVKIPVWNHKTVGTYGSAPVIISTNLHKKIQIFINRFRSKLSATCGKTLFTSWSGRSLQSSDPSKMLHRLWGDSGNFEGKEVTKNLTVNLIRKSVSTAARATDSDKKKEIALAMSHSTKTADMHYDIVIKDRNELKGARAIQSLLRGECSPKKPPRKVWSEAEVTVLKEEYLKGTSLHEIPLNASPRQKYDKLRKCSPEVLLTVSLGLV